MIPDAPIPRLNHIKSLLARIQYKDWEIKADIMGHGHYIQPVLSELDGKGERWKGRKWYISRFATDSEIVATAFKSILTAEEHETRESFLFDGLLIYGPHQSLDALKASARQTDTRH